MKDMVRYFVIENKNQREIVLLKGYPCVWGKCAFCDYISDNETQEEKMVSFNSKVLSNVTGQYGALEVINSGSVFELPKETLKQIKQIVKEKKIQLLFFESYWSYRERLQEIRDYFGVPIIFKCGIETFDNEYRNKILKKGFLIKYPAQAAQYFQSICLMVGIQGQTKQMIQRDIEYLLQYFRYGCVNIFTKNTTDFLPDENLIHWFYNNYRFLDNHPTIEVLWNNTDFGVGGAV